MAHVVCKTSAAALLRLFLLLLLLLPNPISPKTGEAKIGSKPKELGNAASRRLTGFSRGLTKNKT